MRQIMTLVSLICAADVYADEITLFDWGVYINGTTARSAADLPGNVTFSDDFFETGLGTVTMSFSTATSTDYDVAMFFDHEIDEYENSFFNEYGMAGGAPEDTRLTYEMDEPGFGTGSSTRITPDTYNYIGDIYDNFTAFTKNGFDNQLFYDGYTGESLSGFETPIYDDVSMAMGWKFSLKENEAAVLEYTVSTSAPATGFYLAQLDRTTAGAGIYLQSRLNISPVGVPEPGIVGLLGIGLLFVGLVRRIHPIFNRIHS